MAEAQATVWPLPEDLAYVGTDGHIYVLHADGYTPQRVTWNAKGLSYGVWQSEDDVDRIRYFWPTWSPLGDKIACLGTYGQDGQESGTGVYVLDLVQGVESWEIWAGAESAPIYINWAPDGERLTFLLQREDELRLAMASLSRPGETVPLLSGLPLFHGFSPDGLSVAVHLGGNFNGEEGRRLYLVDLDSPEQRLTLSIRPGLFGTPSWSPDGRYLAFTIEENDEQRICLNEHALSPPIKRGAFSGLGAMLWSPDSKDILVATTPSPRRNAFSNLWKFPVNGDAPTLLAKTDLLAFECTREGHIVFLQAGGRDGSLTWKVLEPDGSQRTLVTFYPSRPQMLLVHFFHQYKLSHNLFSPDGKSMVFSGYLTRKEMEDDYTLPRIYVVDVATGSTPVPVADGSIACWSPGRQPLTQ